MWSSDSTVTRCPRRLMGAKMPAIGILQKFAGGCHSTSGPGKWARQSVDFSTILRNFATKLKGSDAWKSCREGVGQSWPAGNCSDRLDRNVTSL